MPSENAAPAVETRAVSRQYGYVPALRAVSLDIGQGEFVALFGHNGAGKTTLLRLIATHLRPSSGTIRIFGNDVPACGPGIKRRIGLLTHENYLYPELTIQENLQFYARLFSIDDEESYQDLVDYFGLRRWYTAGVGTLSFGLRKRADLVRALLHRPDLILLDEPFAGLDIRTCDLLVDHFRSQKEEGKTVLLSSHSREWIEKLCDRELVFDKGTIIHDISCG